MKGGVKAHLRRQNMVVMVEEDSRRRRRKKCGAASELGGDRRGVGTPWTDEDGLDEVRGDRREESGEDEV